MKEITIKLYNIDELKELNRRAYDKIIDNEKQFLIDDNFNYASEHIIEILKEKYNLSVDEKNIYYSISYSQGDGMCFTLNNILSYTRLKNKNNLNAFEQWIIDNINDDDMLLLLDYLNSNYNLNIVKKSHSYQHPYTCIIDYEYFYSSDDPVYIDRMNNFMDELCKKLFDEVYIEICSYIESVLYTYYDVDDDECLYDINGIQY